MDKVKANYSVDLMIAFSFLGSALSGFLFILPLEWLPVDAAGVTNVLGVILPVWSQLHTLSSIVMVLGVGLHLVLHWKWIIATTRKYLRALFTQSAGKPAASPVYVTTAQNKKAITRRRFLALGSVALAGTLAGWGLKDALDDDSMAFVSILGDSDDDEGVSFLEDADETLDDDESPFVSELEVTTDDDHYAPGADAGELTSDDAVISPGNPAASNQSPNTRTRCPKGLVNDPYPGRCRHYVDEDGNGYCDLSEVGT